MNKTTLPGVTISHVERTHTLWRYFWPIQSRRALLSTLAVQGVGLPLMGLFAYLAAPHALPQIVAGAAAGGLYFGLYPYLPARLTLATRSEARHHLDDLQARVVQLRYLVSEHGQRPGRFHYRSKRSRLWRWDEEDIELLVRDHELVLNGPNGMLAYLRAQLLAPEDFYYLNKKA